MVSAHEKEALEYLSGFVPGRSKQSQDYFQHMKVLVVLNSLFDAMFIFISLF